MQDGSVIDPNFPGSVSTGLTCCCKRRGCKDFTCWLALSRPHCHNALWTLERSENRWKLCEGRSRRPPPSRPRARPWVCCQSEMARLGQAPYVKGLCLADRPSRMMKPMPIQKRQTTFWSNAPSAALGRHTKVADMVHHARVAPAVPSQILGEVCSHRLEYLRRPERQSAEGLNCVA